MRSGLDLILHWPSRDVYVSENNADSRITRLNKTYFIIILYIMLFYFQRPLRCVYSYAPGMGSFCNKPADRMLTSDDFNDDVNVTAFWQKPVKITRCVITFRKFTYLIKHITDLQNRYLSDFGFDMWIIVFWSQKKQNKIMHKIYYSFYEA